MKYLFLIILVLFSTSSLFSQPVLTNKSIPQVGEKYTYSYYDTVGVKQGNAGSNITWDFSKLNKLSGTDNTVNFEIVDPSNGPQSNLFKDATYAYKQSMNDADNAYGYYKASSDKIERLGTGFTEGAELLTDWELVSKFPFTYENSFKDKFIGKIDVSADGEKFTLNRGGEITAVADAYGSVILPNGTFQNVLRLKIMQAIGDTLPPPIPGFPGGLMETITETYAWVSDDYKFALLTISFITSKTTFPGVPTQTVKSMNVTVYEFEPSGGQTLSTPTIKSPSNGATKLSIPVNLEWNESILSKIKKGVEIQENITYTVHVADNSEFSESGTLKVFEVQSNSVEVDNLLNGTKYYWRVKASAGEVESSWSEVYNFITKLTKPTAPTLVSPANGSTNNSISSLRLSWNVNNNIVATRIMVSGPNNFDELVDKETSFELTNLTANSNYTWKVKFYNAEGDSSEWSEEWTFSTEPETSVEDVEFVKNLNINYDNFDNQINIHLDSENHQYLTINLYDLNGNLIITQQNEIHFGNNVLIVNLPSLSKGAYFVQMYSNNHILIKPIIVQ